MAFEFKASDTSAALNIAPDQGALTIQFPAVMSGTAVDVLGSIDGTNYLPIYVDGVKLTIPFIASSLQCVRAAAIFGITSLKLKSTASETTRIGARTGRVVS
jgi:hypothetical protein